MTIPHVWFDGSERVVGGGTNMRPYCEPIITRRLDYDPCISIDLSGSSIDENGGTVNIHLEVLQDIVKDFVIDQGWYGQVNAEDIGVAVVVQSQSQKTVLNACDLSKVDVELTPENLSVPKGSDFDITVHLTNITPWAQPVKAWLDVVLPNGNELPSNPFEDPINLPMPGGSVINHPMTLTVPNNAPTGDYRLRLGVGDQTNDAMHYEYDYMTVTVTNGSSLSS